MDLPKLIDLDVKRKKVLLRLDLDLTDGEINVANIRLRSALNTLNYLISEEAKIVILGHRGRPGGKKVENLSLAPLALVLSELTGKEVIFEGEGDISLKENLRFDPGEEANDPEFSKKLASLGEVYVNEAFGNSHRSHASIVGISGLLPSAVGLHFSSEVENLSKVTDKPKRPLVYIISGVKEDKIRYIGEFEKSADKILVGGRLPDFLGDSALESVRTQKGKVIVGNLIMDKEDITLNTIEVFEKEVKDAGTVVLAGPLGKYEDIGHRQGTERVFKAVVSSSAFKVAGGGDTEGAISILGMENAFDWISVGGGAMLEFLSKKTLPGIESLSADRQNVLM
ncbi:MAG TPA: phosphoglycerate kinase [Patescibacteria group bacterium]|nr:phosphoglycerate kinase [Patescibacteria group bacterium]